MLLKSHETGDGELEEARIKEYGYCTCRGDG